MLKSPFMHGQPVSLAYIPGLGTIGTYLLSELTASRIYVGRYTVREEILTTWGRCLEHHRCVDSTGFRRYIQLGTIRLLDIPRLSAPRARSPAWLISDLSPATCPSTGPIRSRKTVHTASRAKFSRFKAQYPSLQAVGVGLGTSGIRLLLVLAWGRLVSTCCWNWLGDDWYPLAVGVGLGTSGIRLLLVLAWGRLVSTGCWNFRHQ